MHGNAPTYAVLGPVKVVLRGLGLGYGGGSRNERSMERSSVPSG
jgi:hypothetical protein